MVIFKNVEARPNASLLSFRACGINFDWLTDISTSQSSLVSEMQFPLISLPDMEDKGIIEQAEKMAQPTHAAGAPSSVKLSFTEQYIFHARLSVPFQKIFNTR